MTDINIGRQSGADERRHEPRAAGGKRRRRNRRRTSRGRPADWPARRRLRSPAKRSTRPRGMMQQQMEMGADYVRMVSQTAHTAARELEGKAPELARLVHDIADRADSFANDLRRRQVNEMFDVDVGFRAAQSAHVPRRRDRGGLPADALRQEFGRAHRVHEPAQRVCARRIRLRRACGIVGYGGSYGGTSGASSGGRSTSTTASPFLVLQLHVLLDIDGHAGDAHDRRLLCRMIASARRRAALRITLPTEVPARW